MIRIVLLLACCAFTGSAAAENVSTARILGLATAFTLCGDSGGQKTCTTDKWSIEVTSDGWEMQATSTLNGNTTQWGETCRGGTYSYRGAGIAWRGTCKLAGDAKALCFHTDLRAHPAPGMTARTDQCFAVTGRTCTMTIKGKSNMIGEDGVSILNTFDTYAEDVTECHVIGTLD